MPGSETLLDLLYAGAPKEAYDALLAEAEQGCTPGPELDQVREQHAVALRLRDRMLVQQNRQAQLTALYETANDLIAIRDVDAILAAIVRRARQLLDADMTYLSLNDEAEGASFMKVTDGSISAEFRNLRLPLGTGLLGLVAQTGAPYFTDDYQNDERFVHRDYIDHAVGDEGIRAILGVPLILEGKVIGALLAVHRQVRVFPSSEITLLTSFAVHAAVALENARLFEATRAALAEVDDANTRLSQQSRSVQLAADAHDRLTDVLLHGGDLEEVSRALGEVLDGQVDLYDAQGAALTARTPPTLEARLGPAVEESRGSGRSVLVEETGRPLTYVSAALAGAEHLGTVVLSGRDRALDTSGRRTLERGAVVTAVVLLFTRSVADAEDRVRGELLADLLAGREVDRVRLRERARRHHADLDRLDTVLVAAVEDRHRAAPVAARFAREGGGLGGAHQEGVVAVVPGSDPLVQGRALAERLRQHVGGPVTVGVSRTPHGRADAVREAWLEARTCLTTLLTLGRAGQVSDARGLGLARLVLGHNGPEELGAFLETTLGPLLDYDRRRGTDLVLTLETWFGCGGTASETARRLHVHANTVAQRLERIGTLLGEGWREPEQALEQQMALRLWRMSNMDTGNPTL